MTSETINTIPVASATFITDLQTFLKEEDADRFKDMHESFVLSGGTHVTGGGLTHTPDSIVAYPGGHYVTETGAITYPNDTTHIWVIVHKDTTTAVTDWTRESGTHYLFRNTGSAIKPVVPVVDSTILMKVTTTSGTVTVVEDHRNLSLQNTRKVQMVRTGVRIFTVYKADGTVLDITGTTTGGLQEAIDEAFNGTNQYPLLVTGGMREVGADDALINCTTQVAFPPLDMTSVRFEGVTLNFPNILGATAGLFIDSCMMVSFEFLGSQIVYQGTGDAVLFAPTNPTPLDNLVTIIQSHFHFTNSGGGGNAVVHFKTSALGGIGESTFIWDEINADGPTNAVLVTGNATTSFIGNYFKCMSIHGTSDVIMQIGTTSTDLIRGNTWVGRFGSTLATAEAINTYATEDIWICQLGVPVGGKGITLNTGAAKNHFRVGQFDSVNLGANRIIHTSTSYNNLVEYQHTRAQDVISVGGSPFTHQNTDALAQSVTVAAGTVSNIEFSPDNISFFVLLLTGGMFELQPGEALRVTYSVAPTMRKFI